MSRYPKALITQRALQRYAAGSGVEQSQGDPYKNLPPSVRQKLQIPNDPGINIHGWRNPYKATAYGFPVPDQATASAVRALAGNARRCYLLIQNKGPGNLFLNFGTEPSPNGGNCLSLIATQFYELIGGGGVFPDGNTSLPSSFVPRDDIYVLSDAASTTCTIVEGVWTDTRVF